MDKGPDFLLKLVKDWPSRFLANPDRSICTATVVMSQVGIVDISRFFSWNRSLKTTAIVRFSMSHLLDPSSTPKLTAIDFQLATETLLRQWQLASFPAVFGKLLRKESLSYKYKLSTLNPFVDEQQVIHCSGRLQYAMLPAATRMPVVIDIQSAITRLLVVHFHEICHNAGPEYVKSFLQQGVFHFWRPCHPSHHQLSLLLMPPLSRRKCRANDGALTSMPISIHRYAISVLQLRSRCVNGKLTVKHYSLIFPASSPMRHLETYPALTTDSFIKALRRVIARRGQSQYICSDNGKHFVGGRRELEEALNAGIPTALQTPPLAPDMEWHFNPPFAPHFGGAWERLIQTAKKTLRHILGSDSRTVSHNPC